MQEHTSAELWKDTTLLVVGTPLLMLDKGSDQKEFFHKNVMRVQKKISFGFELKTFRPLSRASTAWLFWLQKRRDGSDDQRRLVEGHHAVRCLDPVVSLWVSGFGCRVEG